MLSGRNGEGLNARRRNGNGQNGRGQSSMIPQAFVLCNKPFDHYKYLCLASLYLLSFKNTKYVQKTNKQIKLIKKKNLIDPVFFRHL